MQLSSALRERDREDFDRVEKASRNPDRKNFPDPLDARLECPLGRLRVKGKISEAEYQAGVKWRTAYNSYINTIQNPEEHSDEDCANAQKIFMRGRVILEKEGKRVLHAVNAIAVFEEPEGLGDFEFTAKAARIGLAALAKSF
jgi:hypothetical protein